MQRLGVSKAVVSWRLFSNNVNAKNVAAQPQITQASAGRILATGIVVAGAAVAYNMHIDDEFRCSVEENVPGASDVLAKVTGEKYKVCTMKAAKDDTSQPVGSISATAGDGGGMSTPNFAKISVATPFDKAPQILDKIGEALDGNSADEKLGAAVCPKKRDSDEPVELLPLPTFGLWNPFRNPFKNGELPTPSLGDAAVTADVDEAKLPTFSFSLPKPSAGVEVQEADVDGKIELLPLPNIELWNPFGKKSASAEVAVGEASTSSTWGFGGFTLPKIKQPVEDASVEVPEVGITGSIPRYEVDIESSLPRELPEISIETPTVTGINMGGSWGEEVSAGIEGEGNLVPLPVEFWNGKGDLSGSAQGIEVAIEALPGVDLGSSAGIERPAFDTDVGYDASVESAQKPTLYLAVVSDEDLSGDAVEIVATGGSAGEDKPKSKKAENKWPLYDPVVYQK